MSGIEWMNNLLKCEQARRKLPLGLQATLPLPGRRGENTVECWYYRLDSSSGEPTLYSPERYVLWEAKAMKMLDMKSLQPTLLGSGADLLTRTHREKEDAFLEGALTDFLNGSIVNQDEMAGAWLNAAPQAMKQWLYEAIQEES